MRCIAELDSKVISWNGVKLPNARDFSLQIFVKQQPNATCRELCSGKPSSLAVDFDKYIAASEMP